MSAQLHIYVHVYEFFITSEEGFENVILLKLSVTNIIVLPSPVIIFSFDAALNAFLSSNCYVFQVWARIWSVLANHFISAGSHHDEKIAMYAIDSLRQLSMKYLERAELANFSFQNDILKPFVVLMRNSQSESKRRLIVDCIVQV